MLDLLIQPWPWYISGALIGFTVPLLLLIGNKSFGISSSFRNGLAACGVGNMMEYFRFDWKAQQWNFLFLFGVILAGFVALTVLEVEQNELSQIFLSYLSERDIAVESIFPSTYFSESMGSISTLLLIVGGIFIGFGSRYAGGCTSGHAITGLSQLSLSSVIAVIGFFVGGLLATFLIIDNLL